MAIIKRCKRCKKLLFFKSKLYMDNYYCAKCVVIVRAIEEKNEKIEHRKKIAEKKLQVKKAGIRNKIADKKLLEDLESEKIKQQQKIQKKAEKLRLKQRKKEIKPEEEYQVKRQTHQLYFDKDEIQEHDSLLYVEVSVTRLIAIEWFHGKKRVVLNHKREVRRTKAGGYSAEKFQKFVDAKKKKTGEWAIDLFSRSGVLRDRYNLIKVVSTNDIIKEELESYLNKHRR